MTPHAFARLFPEFRRPSWAAWRKVLKRLTPKVREFYAICGRGSGKSRIVALLAAYYATRHYEQAPGEQITIGVFAPDRRQAGVTLRYITGLLRADTSLAALIVAETAERVVLQGDVVVEVISASKASPRGRSYGLAIVEEASMLPVGDAASDPDVEIVRAIRPGLARVPGSLLAVIGSPYAKSGITYEATKAGETPDRIVVKLDTFSLNPSFSLSEIERAFHTDPVAAASEYGRPGSGSIEFRPDVSGLLDDAAIAAVVPASVREIAPDRTRAAVAHFDASTGSGQDAAAVAIAFRPGVLACIRQWRPPFSPAAVVREAAELCRQYGVTAITIDRFAPGIVADLWREHGIKAKVATVDTSGAFITLLALINSGRVSLLDHEVLLRELRGLERRAGSAGRDLVTHASRQHDDLAAAAAFALVAATTRPVGGVLAGKLTWDFPRSRPTAPWEVSGDARINRLALASYMRAIRGGS